MGRADMLQLPLLLESDFENELTRARWLYAAIFRSGVRLWGGLPLMVQQEKELEARFWHVVTTGEVVRRLDRARVAGVGRMWYLLDSLSRGEPGVRWWVESHGRERRYCVAPEDFGYLIVLKTRGEGFALVTAYCCTSHRERYARRHAEAAENDETEMRLAQSCPTRRRRRAHPDHPMWVRVDGVCRMPSVPMPAKVRTRGGMPSSFADDHYATAAEAAIRARRRARRAKLAAE